MGRVAAAGGADPNSQDPCKCVSAGCFHAPASHCSAKGPSWGAPRTCPSHPGGTAQEDNTPEPSSQGKGCGVWDHQAEPHLTRLVIPTDTSRISGLLRAPQLRLVPTRCQHVALEWPNTPQKRLPPLEEAAGDLTGTRARTACAAIPAKACTCSQVQRPSVTPLIGPSPEQVHQPSTCLGRGRGRVPGSFFPASYLSWVFTTLAMRRIMLPPPAHFQTTQVRHTWVSWPLR